MCHKKNGQRRYKYFILARDKSYVVKLNTLVLPKSSLNSNNINKLEFLLMTTYLLCLVDVSFNR